MHRWDARWQSPFFAFFVAGGGQRATRRVAPTVNIFIIGPRKEGREWVFPPYAGAGNEFPKGQSDNELSHSKARGMRRALSAQMLTSSG